MLHCDNQCMIIETVSPQSIREFWFGNSEDDAQVVAAQSKLWWSKNAVVDAAMRQRFEPSVKQAARGHLDDWLSEPQSRLALILLADQFTRNIYRNTARMYALDSLALAWCKYGIDNGAAGQLRPIERVFLYMPLMHSESLKDQQGSVALFEELSLAVPEAQRKPFDGSLDFARRHRDVIARFGRFPHRNALLQRTSTAKETAFLQEPGSSF